LDNNVAAFGESMSVRLISILTDGE